MLVVVGCDDDDVDDGSVRLSRLCVDFLLSCASRRRLYRAHNRALARSLALSRASGWLLTSGDEIFTLWRAAASIVCAFRPVDCSVRRVRLVMPLFALVQRDASGGGDQRARQNVSICYDDNKFVSPSFSLRLRRAPTLKLLRRLYGSRASQRKIARQTVPPQATRAHAAVFIRAALATFSICLKKTSAPSRSHTSALKFVTIFVRAKTRRRRPTRRRRRNKNRQARRWRAARRERSSDGGDDSGHLAGGWLAVVVVAAAAKRMRLLNDKPPFFACARTTWRARAGRLVCRFSGLAQLGLLSLVVVVVGGGGGGGGVLASALSRLRLRVYLRWQSSCTLFCRRFQKFSRPPPLRSTSPKSLFGAYATFYTSRLY